MAKLFISHASEDKDAFVRALADALRSNKHEVWYDEYSIQVGDSLREKIDEGLRSCEFGIVVLSKAFFAKPWTENELGGLFALETKNKKLILPIWHEVTREDVASYSPMLADRMGARSSKGIAAVVEELESKISASNRTREVSLPNSGASLLLSISDQFSSDENEHRRLFSIPGRNEVEESAGEINAAILAQIEEVARTDGGKRFAAKTVFGKSLIVKGPLRHFFQSEVSGLAINSAMEAEFSVRIGKMPEEEYSQEPASVIEEMIFKPRMLGTAPVVWDEGTGATSRLSPIGVANRIIERFAGHIQEATPPR